jgi:uncharacterized iron-regulated membrane protein
MTFKGPILFIHRWLGFISGLVVFIVSITGCIFCFQDEIQDAVHSWRKVPEQHKAYITPSTLKTIAIAKFPGSTANYIYYFGRDRPAAVLANVPKQGFTDIYIDPYTGHLLHTEALTANFFTIIEYIHLYLLLPSKIGQLVVGISVIIFVVLMITGIVLWWPKRKVDHKRSFTIKWNGRWRRINYDLHNVLGFYATIIALILAITGLAIAFDCVDKAIYATANLGKSHANERTFPVSGPADKGSASNQPVIDQVFIQAEKFSPNAEMFLITDDGGKKSTINVTAYNQSLHYGHSDFYYFDRYTGKILQKLPYSQKSLGLKLNDLNYDLHVGQALGLFGKILAFLASLICASLPVTGFIVWLGKRKKTKLSPARTVSHRRLNKQQH